MSTYDGQAVLVTEDGTEVAVTAKLHGDSQGWSGTLETPAHRKRDLLNLTTGRLRIKDKGEGAFVRPDTSDWIDSPASLFKMRIMGNGDAPF
jgi:hypothetical protein